MKRIGIFGGTFDPPHRGHLAVAIATADHFDLDQVLFAPTGIQPLKRHHRAASFPDRCAMLELLTGADPRLTVTRADAPHRDGSPNYTIDLLRTLKDSLPPQSTLFNIVGLDAFRGLPDWLDPKALLALCDWILVSRPGEDIATAISNTLTELDVPTSSPHIHPLTDIFIPISATEIRDRLHSAEPCNDLLTPSVLTYIQTHNLYP